MSRVLGLESGSTPFAAKCPLCGVNSNLQVHSWEWIHCLACRFAGNAVDLHAKLHGTDVSTSISCLIAQDCMIPESKPEAAEFAQRIRFAAQIRDHHRRLGAVVIHEPATYRGLFERNGIPFSGPDLVTLKHEMVPVLIGDVEDLLEKGAKAFMRRNTCIALLATHAGWPTGYWLVSPRGTACFWFEQLPGDTPPGCIAFGDSLSVAGPTLVVNSLMDGVRLQVKSARDFSSASDIVVSRGSLYPVPPRGIAWLGNDPTNVLPMLGKEIAVLPGDWPDRAMVAQGSGYDPRVLISRAGRFGVVPEVAFVRNLLALPRKERDLAMAGISLSPHHQTLVRAACGDQEAEILAPLWGQEKPKGVQWGKRSLQETEDGWVSGNETLSQAVLRIERIEPTGSGDGIAYGWIRYGGSRFGIQEQLSVLRKKTGEWVRNACLDRGVGSPVIDRKLGEAMFDVAQLFHPPVMVRKDPGTVSQDGPMVRFPRFTITRHGITPATQAVPGPHLPVPVPLTPVELSGLGHAGSYELTLVIAGNLYRVAHGIEPVGVLTQNRPLLVERYAQQMGLVTQLGLEGAAGPLPVPFAGKGIALTRALEPGYRFCSVNAPTWQTMGLIPGWVRLSREAPPDLRCLRVAFLALPRLLSGTLDPLGPSFYRDISKVIQGLYSGATLGACTHVAGALDSVGAYHLDQVAPRLVHMLSRAAQAGAVVPVQVPGGVGIPWVQVQAAYGAAVVPPPDLSHAQEILHGMRCLAPEGSIGIQEAAWRLIHGE